MRRASECEENRRARGQNNVVGKVAAKDRCDRGAKGTHVVAEQVTHVHSCEHARADASKCRGQGAGHKGGDKCGDANNEDGAEQVERGGKDGRCRKGGDEEGAFCVRAAALGQGACHDERAKRQHGYLQSEDAERAPKLLEADAEAETRDCAADKRFLGAQRVGGVRLLRGHVR